MVMPDNTPGNNKYSEKYSLHRKYFFKPFSFLQLSSSVKDL